MLLTQSRILVLAFIDSIFQVYSLVLVARVFLSWIPLDRSNTLIAFVVSVTDPLLKPISKRIPPLGGIVDISPIIAFLLLGIVRNILLRLFS